MIKLGRHGHLRAVLATVLMVRTPAPEEEPPARLVGACCGRPLRAVTAALSVVVAR
jgi:hypothetical protein